MLRFVTVSLGAGGPVRCTRCGGPSAAPSYRPASEVASEIQALSAVWGSGPGPNVELSGPEPFAHPELPALVAASGHAGVRRLRLVTDAAALSSPANASGSIAAGVRHMAFTLLGGSPGVHDALAGEPGTFEATLEGVRSYVAAGTAQEAAVCVTALVPVCRHNVHDLAAAVSAAVQAGANAVSLTIEDGGLDVRAAVPWIVAACDTGVVNAVWVEVVGMPFCLMPGHDLHIADTVRERGGEKGPGCGRCPLDAVCAGGPVGSAAEILALLAAPEGAERLAANVARSRGMSL